MKDLNVKYAEVLTWLEMVLNERFAVYFKVYFSKSEMLVLTIDGTDKKVIFDCIDLFFLSSSTEQPGCDSWDAAYDGWDAPLGLPLSAPTFKKLSDTLIEKQDENYYIHYDILGLVYWVLARVEEVQPLMLDNHERFSAFSSHAYKHHYLERPIVDEWLNILGQVLKRQWPSIFLKEHTFMMQVSHDVDTPLRDGFWDLKYLMRSVGSDILKRFDFQSAFKKIWINEISHKKLSSLDQYNTFRWLMDLSEQHGLNSAFYFICGRTDKMKDGRYEIEQPGIRKLLNDIHTRGHEIGLHPSYGTYQNPEMIVSEANRLYRVCAEEGIEQKVWGGRMHYLRWQHPLTMYGWLDAGMTYDSTLGYAEYAGFRCGTCFEYPGFDPVKQQRLNIRIRPLIAMDCTVMASRYMGLGQDEQALSIFTQLKQYCSKVGGGFNLLWHNSELDTMDKRNLYSAILDFQCSS